MRLALESCILKSWDLCTSLHPDVALDDPELRRKKAMKALCPNSPDHKTFLTNAFVAQVWKVDAEGNFLESVWSDQTARRPDPKHIWTCGTCGALAKLE